MRMPEFQALERRIATAETRAEYLTALKELPYTNQLSARLIRIAQHRAFGKQATEEFLSRCEHHSCLALTPGKMSTYLLELLRDTEDFTLGNTGWVDGEWMVKFNDWQVQHEDLERALLLAAIGVAFSPPGSKT